MPKTSRPLVAVPTDVKPFENYTWHAAPEQYLAAAIDVAGVTPLLVPSFGDRMDLDAILDAVDGLLVTGSKSNVHPALYGVEPNPAFEPYDNARDATSLPLIRAAIEKGVPVLAICRGIQELNVALGGTLATEIQELEGRMDHRAPESESQAERFAIQHPIKLNPNSCLAEILKEDSVRVNSVHRQAIDRLAPQRGRSRCGRRNHRSRLGEECEGICRRRPVAPGILGAFRCPFPQDLRGVRRCSAPTQIRE